MRQRRRSVRHPGHRGLGDSFRRHAFARGADRRPSTVLPEHRRRVFPDRAGIGKERTFETHLLLTYRKNARRRLLRNQRPSNPPSPSRSKSGHKGRYPQIPRPSGNESSSGRKRQNARNMAAFTRTRGAAKTRPWASAGTAAYRPSRTRPAVRCQWRRQGGPLGRSKTVPPGVIGQHKCPRQLARINVT